MSTEQFARSARRTTLAAGIAVLLAGCAGQATNDTGLYGTATHTGTLYSYRVPPAPMPAEDRLSARFLPLRGSMELADFARDDGIIRSDLHVTEDDFITVSLGAVYLKYFEEAGGGLFGGGGDARKGEIAFVLSFDAGATKRESFVVFSSGEQTLGSYLSVQDWPMLGPLKVDGDSLKMRIVMIELDQAENARIRQLTRAVGSIAGQVEPGLGAALKVAQPFADALIALNGDDVILDQRFALQRIDANRKYTELQRPPLLEGRYVLLLQEDRLKGRDVARVADVATAAPAQSNVRFDLDSNRLFRTYDYWTDRWGWTKQDRVDGALPVVTRLDLSEIPDLKGCPAEKKDDQTQYEDHEDAARIRQQVLGYERPRTTGLERWNCLHQALNAAYCESLRGEAATPVQRVDSASTPPGDDGKDAVRVAHAVCAQADDSGPDGHRPPFDFPVMVYPTANAVLAQYPLHTHVVLTVERSLGGQGDPVHEKLQSFEDFTREQIETASDVSAVEAIGQQLVDALTENRRQRVLLRKVGATEEANEKLCLLFGGLGTGGEGGALNDAPLFNEIYHVSGEVLTTRADVKAYLAKHCTGATCSCDEAVKTADSASSANRQPAGPPSLALTDPLMTGDAVTALQVALAKAGFAVPEDEAGSFGPKTNAAVRSFQVDRGLEVDGVVGPATRKALGL